MIFLLQFICLHLYMVAQHVASNYSPTFCSSQAFSEVLLISPLLSLANDQVQAKAEITFFSEVFVARFVSFKILDQDDNSSKKLFFSGLQYCR